MVLKRKRSSSEFSVSSSLASPPRPDTTSFEFSAIVPSSLTFLNPRSATPSHLPSRTMKRFRDNRPSEAEIHQRTLNLLYSAQRHKVCEPEPQAQDIIVSPPEPQAPPPPQQRSLESFWGLPLHSRGPSVTAERSMPEKNYQDCVTGYSDTEEAMELDS